MGKLVPDNPSEVMVIRKITPNITTLSLPFWRIGILRIGGRATLVKLQSGGIAVFSPVSLTQEVKETVAEMGEVKYITAPDIEHHIKLGEWHAAYPNAKVIGPEGLPEKRAKQKNEDVPFATIFTAKDKDKIKVDPEFDAEFEYEYIPSHPNKELAFLHKPSKTLIEADMLFNLPATEQFSKTNESPTGGILSRLFVNLYNTHGEALAQRRFVWYAIGTKKGFNESVKRIAGWDFDRIIPCHGEVIETGGKKVWENVMKWNIQAEGK